MNTSSQMTRYRVHAGEYAEDSDGDFVRADDPAIASAVTAMEYAIQIITGSIMIAFKDSGDVDDRIKNNPCLCELRLAIYNLTKGPA